jgi:hypothetical protein
VTTAGDRGPGNSLRHVFCTTALFAWRIEASDVSRLAGAL